ncbi:MAG: hypothetical protein WBO34_08450 [Gammaproteobacteria bacterium]
MIICNNVKTVGNFVLLAVVAATPISGKAQPEYSYSDEWPIVSAPPPSGPFRSIHLDPRIPGQGIAPPSVTTSFDDQMGPVADDMTADTQAELDASVITDLPAPAAGTPTTQADTEAPETAQQHLPAPPVTAAEAPSMAPPPGLLPPPPGPAMLSAPPVADAEPMPESAELAAPPVATTEPAPMAPPGMTPQMPEPAELAAPPVAATEPAPMAPPGMMPPMPEPPELAAPPVAATEPAPMAPPGMMPPMQGAYQDMPPPAAGRMDRQADWADIKPATRPPLTRQYGRMMPQPPGNFDYRAPGWQYGRSDIPGYRNRPSYGYPRAPADWQEEEVPPPPAYPARPYQGDRVYP